MKGFYKKGFTLLELMVTIAIIGIISTIVLVNLSEARERSKVSWTVSEIHEMKNAAMLYFSDTGQFPPPCNTIPTAWDFSSPAYRRANDPTCSAAVDPFMNNPYLSGPYTNPILAAKWKGPYFSGGFWNLKHPWGGHFTVQTRDASVPFDNVPELIVFLDDDAPETPGNDDSGKIPTSALLKIDKTYDDGVLNTGEAQGNPKGGFGDPINVNPPAVGPWNTAPGEMVIILHL